MTKQCIIFDLDGTLLNREQSLINFLSYQHSKHDFLKYIPQKKFIEFFIKSDANGYVAKEVVYAMVINEFKVPKNPYNKLLREYYQSFNRFCIAYPGVDELLHILKNNGFTLGIITNGRYPFQMDNIRSLGIEHYFSCILISEKEGFKKPDKEIFFKAIIALGVQTENIIFVGDNPKTDIEGAKRLGIKTTFIKSKYWNTCHEADFTIADIRELLVIVEKVFSKNLNKNKNKLLHSPFNYSTNLHLAINQNPHNISNEIKITDNEETDLRSKL